jgi:hypothetical protein
MAVLILCGEDSGPRLAAVTTMEGFESKPILPQTLQSMHPIAIIDFQRSAGRAAHDRPLLDALQARHCQLPAFPPYPSFFPTIDRAM